MDKKKTKDESVFSIFVRWLTVTLVIVTVFAAAYITIYFNIQNQ